MKKIASLFLVTMMVILSMVFLSTFVYAEEENYTYNEETKTITLTKNIELSNTWTIDEGEEYILDLNGYTLTFDLSTIESQDEARCLEINGSLTIIDSNKTGIINAVLDSTSRSAIKVTGTLIINGGTINTPKSYGVFLDGGTFIVNSGAISSQYAIVTSTSTTATNEKMNIEINNGVLTSNYGAAIAMHNEGTLSITGGTINGGISIRAGTINISGGTINAATNTESFDSVADYIKDSWPIDTNVWLGDALYVMVGTLSNSDILLNITGGTFNCTNETGSAVAVYDLGKTGQKIEINISGSANLLTNAFDKAAYQEINFEDLGITSSTFGVYSGNINVVVTGATYSDVKIIPYYDNNMYMLLDNENGTYTVVLKSDYPEEKYNIIVNENGSVRISEKEENPKTLDKIMMYAVICACSVIVIISTLIYSMRKKV